MSDNTHGWMRWKVWATTCFVAALLGVLTGVVYHAAVNDFGGPGSPGAALPAPTERADPASTMAGVASAPGASSRSVVGGSPVAKPKNNQVKAAKADVPKAKPPKAKPPKVKVKKDAGESKKAASKPAKAAKSK